MKVQLFIFCIFLLFLTLSVQAIEYGENYDQECIDNVCTINVYSYQKYYQSNNQWTQIDENFKNTNCAEGYSYCINNNLYQIDIGSSNSAILLSKDNSMLSFTLSNIAGLTALDKQPEISNNVVTYRDIIPGVDIQYTYLPNKLKEEIIIKNNDLANAIQRDLDITFNLNTFSNSIETNNNNIRIGQFYISHLTAYDTNGSSTDLSYNINNNQLTITVPMQWLKESRQYPITIDPTFSISPSTDITISNSTTTINTYTRLDTSTNSIGNQGDWCSAPPANQQVKHRTIIELNLTNINNNGTVQKAYFNFTLSDVGDVPFKNFSLYNMEADIRNIEDNSTYCFGNCHLAMDAGNGTIYASFSNDSAVINQKQALELNSYALNDIETDLGSSIDMFGIGFTNDNELSCLPFKNGPKMHSQEAADSSKRPVLTLVINANEPDSDAAIEEGILNAIPEAIIHNYQQIYSRSSLGTQQLGTFDKFAVYGNQRWGINYISSGEQYTNMNNVSSTFFVLEMEDLLTHEITQRVYDFITNTLN